uniref:Rhinophrynin-33 n=1 Tax=Rhinophrynus dorsalis TaxID=43566 RepID=RP33_RHIDO|nr:RecName: Full=Rhinophrynin-33; Short=RP-33; Contains: RecName: Full=Rhinophrynin-27; Short=RP-27 [Rhinophrynus dorsalis]
ELRLPEIARPVPEVLPARLPLPALPRNKMAKNQ